MSSRRQRAERVDLVIRERIKNSKKVLLELFENFPRKQGECRVIETCFDEELIIVSDFQKRDLALRELCDLAKEKGYVKDAETFYKAVLKREEMVSTGIGLGVAIPHAKLASIDKFFVMVSLFKDQGVDWKAIDKEPVKLVFLIGGPPNQQAKYLQLLSQLTAAIKNENFRTMLLKSQSPEDIFQNLLNYF